jgi:hypothetical protein
VTAHTLGGGRCVGWVTISVTRAHEPLRLIPEGRRFKSCPRNQILLVSQCVSVARHAALTLLSAAWKQPGSKRARIPAQLSGLAGAAGRGWWPRWPAPAHRRGLLGVDAPLALLTGRNSLSTGGTPPAQYRRSSLAAAGSAGGARAAPDVSWPRRPWRHAWRLPPSPGRVSTSLVV